jgi:hypothetical protein
MSKRRLLYAAIAACCVGILVVALLGGLVYQDRNRNAAFRAKVERIQPGMTEADVKEIMSGELEVPSLSPRVIHYEWQRLRQWRGGRVQAYVLFDQQEIVSEAEHWTDPSLFEDYLHWLDW